MPLAIFSTLGLVSYVFEGLIILLALELSFGGYAGLSTLSGELFGSSSFILVMILAYALGQANSTVAHAILQDRITAYAFGRPSKYLLKNLRETETAEPSAEDGRAADRSIKSTLLAGIVGFLRFSHLAPNWQPFDQKVAERFARFAERHDFHPSRDNALDRQIFGYAFSKVTRDENFIDKHGTILLHYNFSRNMFCALAIALLILLMPYIAPICGELWQYLSNTTVPDAAAEGSGTAPENGTAMPPVLTKTHLIGVYCVLMYCLFRRYLYFFGLFTKQILLSLIEEEPEPAPRFDARHIGQWFRERHHGSA